MDQKKLKIARHEVGHAVMALIYHREVEKISLVGMASPVNTERYMGFTKLLPLNRDVKITVNMEVSRIMIALGGYASEILFYDYADIGGDDLSIAVKSAENLLQVKAFEQLVGQLPEPNEDQLHSIKNPKIKAFINYQFEKAIDALDPLKSIIQDIAAELYIRKEIEGNEFLALFNLHINRDNIAK